MPLAALQAMRVDRSSRHAIMGNGIPALALYERAGRCLPWCLGVALVAGLGGALLGLLTAPAELPSGQAWRIAFVHLPAAWLSMALYAATAVLALIDTLAPPPWPPVAAMALAPTGALMSFLTLWSGALWAKPLWGSWWLWDARLLAEIVLLALFLAFMALRAGLARPERAARAGAMLLAAGLVDLVVLATAVRGWSPLHGPLPSGLTRLPMLDGSVRVPLVLTSIAFAAWCAAATLHRLRSMLIEQGRSTTWVQGQGMVS